MVFTVGQKPGEKKKALVEVSVEPVLARKLTGIVQQKEFASLDPLSLPNADDLMIQELRDMHMNNK